jgi:hypothetical protein
VDENDDELPVSIRNVHNPSHEVQHNDDDIVLTTTRLIFFSLCRTLYRDGGVFRFYRGIAPALFQGPLSRFGDTAANAGVLALLHDYDIPVAAKTGVASISAGLWRITIMPIDAVKTTLQVLRHTTLLLLVIALFNAGFSL